MIDNVAISLVCGLDFFEMGKPLHQNDAYSFECGLDGYELTQVSNRMVIGYLRVVDFVL
jgi:hypothetical protein